MELTNTSRFDIMPNETYVTPDWVWQALYDFNPKFKRAIDPCPVDYKIDWLDYKWKPTQYVATNPPFSHSTLMAEYFLDMLIDKEIAGFALLLPHEWDCAAKRAPICACVDTKLVLTKRIKWDNLEHTSNPKKHHAWYIWSQNEQKLSENQYWPYMF